MVREFQLMDAGQGAVTRALTFFGFVVAAALSLATIFAVLISEFGMVPADQTGFITTTILIATCVAAPMGALAAQNQYRVDRYHSTLHAMASTDPLTGLLNRRSFEKLANEEIERMKRSQHTASVALFDLDDFKQFNDEYGHAFGDRVLTEIARISHSELRGPFDRLGRWGGEEFVILMSNLSLEQAEGVCERLRRRIEAATMSYKTKTGQVTASFGIAPLTVSRGLAQSIEEADEMLYQAKNTGRNKVVCARQLRSVA
ncbi:GGDEF domain-containing protein [Henriciella aquimarina]|uniref:GGDEF domain-containing protein n=1 Tax=Henriciella aquimarina TaxID=545261 RepID=UPI000A06E52B|nr:GGDEF domain-containing protein [Henriciella aquimarina]